MFFHWGDSEGGSEHQINNHSFPGEIQLYGFNAHLFSNLSEAVLHPHGAVGVSVMMQVSDRTSNRGIKPLTAQLKKVRMLYFLLLLFSYFYPTGRLTILLNILLYMNLSKNRSEHSFGVG